jgi:ribosomal-protein-alanine N-acetyltransferase
MAGTNLIDLPIPRIETERLVMTIPPASLAPRMVAFAQDNAEHFAPWDPPQPDGVYSVTYWEKQLAQAVTEFREGRSLRLTLFRREAPEGEVIGTCNFSQIFRGPFQACYLGYKIAARHEGAGLMREALRGAIPYVFEELRLHRIMANYMPHNVRSGHLLSRLGFRVEGTARDYLYIHGAWRDHVLTALTNTQFKEFRWY